MILAGFMGRKLVHEDDESDTCFVGGLAVVFDFRPKYVNLGVFAREAGANRKYMSKQHQQVGFNKNRVIISASRGSKGRN
jgi:hypothetical protein